MGRRKSGGVECGGGGGEDIGLNDDVSMSECMGVDE